MAGLRPTGLPPAAKLPDTSLRVGFVIKDWFFTGDNVKKHLRDKERIVLNRYGATVRKVARHSMKNRSVTRAGKPGYASAPGQPPHAHAMGKGDSGGLKYGPFNILYGYDPVRRSVVIGPRKKPNSKNVPAVLEYGASEHNVKNRKRKDRKIGGTGIIKYEKGNVSGGRKVVGKDKQTYTVWSAKIKSPAQLERVNENEEFLFGQKTWPSVHIAPRPYMHPAAAIVNQQLPRFWAEVEANQAYFTGLN